MELQFPMPLMIHCYQCGKVYDVVLISEEQHDFPCPACGKVEVYHPAALKEKVIATNKKLLKKLGEGR